MTARELKRLMHGVANGDFVFDGEGANPHLHLVVHLKAELRFRDRPIRPDDLEFSMCSLR